MQTPYCEVENTDPEIHKKWLEKHGFEVKEDGTFDVNGFEGKTSVEVDKLFDNIKVNVTSGYYDPLYSMPYDDRIFVMVCGGPSLEKHLDEIRTKSRDPDKYLVVCSNMTAGYLLENGIIPHVHFILDPQEKKQFDVAPGKTNSLIEYWINAACDPSVFNTLKKQGIKPKAFLADFEAEGKAIKTVQESIPPGQNGMMAIQGGTMAGLRAINLADALGFRKMEYYGFDATVEVKDGVARPYAYEKKRGEAIIEVGCKDCGEKFDTTLIFQKQVNEFVSWTARMPWMDIKIIGGGLIDHHYAHVKEHNDKRYQKKYWSYRFTEEYAKIQKRLHNEEEYGVAGIQYMPTVFHAISQLAKRLGSVSVLDYGSSDGKTMEETKKHFWFPPCIEDFCYDPFVEEHSAEPLPADFVICTDVLEHVEPKCTMAVLDHLQALTKRVIFASIPMVPAKKFLSDGRNAHINIRSSEFWLMEFKKRFIISEAVVSGDGEVLLIVGQSIDDVKEITRSMKNA
jgi:uncharacterized Rossmann fold enzyme